MTIPARGRATVHFRNEDDEPHNIALYRTPEAVGSRALFTGEIVEPADAAVYEFETPAPGDLWFICDVHPAMRGRLFVRAG